jgi:hypothetical protein
MKRASQNDLRASLKVACDLAKAGVGFVCIPVIDEADRRNLADQAVERMERIAVIAEAAERKA